MERIVISRHGEPDVLSRETTLDPDPGPGQVRVRVDAVGVNFADVMIRMGLYPDAGALPLVPGFEASGTIDAVGEGVDPSRVGESVVALMKQGAYAEALVVRSDFALAIPEGLDPVTAAALPVNGLTAYQILEVMAPPRPGETVLVHGAAGGVGTLAVQLAQRRGATVMGSASPAKHEFLRSLGVATVFDSRKRNFAATVKAATNGHGADVVLEPRHGRWILESYKAAAPAGRIVMHGFAAAASGKKGSRWAALRTVLEAPWLQVNPISLMNDNKALMGINLGRMWSESDRLLTWLSELLAMAATGAITPVIDRVLPLEKAALAHHRLQDRANVGKIVLVTRRFRDAGSAGWDVHEEGGGS